MTIVPPELTSEGVDLRMRPRFVATSVRPPDQVLELLRGALPGSRFEGTTYESSAVVKVGVEDRHFWSPQLHVSVEADHEGTRLNGMLSPHPTIWSFFLAVYVALAFGGTMGLIFGVSQSILDTTPNAFIAGPITVLLAALTYLVGRAGRRLGSGDTRRLVGFLTDAVNAQIQTN